MSGPAPQEGVNDPEAGPEAGDAGGTLLARVSLDCSQRLSNESEMIQDLLVVSGEVARGVMLARPRHPLGCLGQDGRRLPGHCQSHGGELLTSGVLLEELSPHRPPEVGQRQPGPR